MAGNTKIIGITGGKGGTGKSTVATAIAHRLSEKNNTLLVDADVDCPNDHLLIGIRLKPHSNVEQRIPVIDNVKCTKCARCAEACVPNAIVAIRGKSVMLMKQQCNGCGACKIVCTEDAISWENKQIGRIRSGTGQGIGLLSGELNANEPVSEFIVNRLNHIIGKTLQMKGSEKGYDFILIDTAAGTHCPVIAALERCDHVIAVAEPTPLGEHDLRLMLGLLKKLDTKTSIVINRSDIGDKGLIARLSQEFGYGIISEIPYSKEIVDSYAKTEPIEFDQIGKIVESIMQTE